MFLSSTNIQISWRESGNTLGDIPKERERKGNKKKKGKILRHCLVQGDQKEELNPDSWDCRNLNVFNNQQQGKVR